MIFGRRLTQTDTDISVPRLAGLKESSLFRVKNPLMWSFPQGSAFCFASACPVKYFVNISLGSAKQKVCVRLESVANGRLKDLVTFLQLYVIAQSFPQFLLRSFLYYTMPPPVS